MDSDIRASVKWWLKGRPFWGEERQMLMVNSRNRMAWEGGTVWGPLQTSSASGHLEISPFPSPGRTLIWRCSVRPSWPRSRRRSLSSRAESSRPCRRDSRSSSSTGWKNGRRGRSRRVRRNEAAQRPALVAKDPCGEQPAAELLPPSRIRLAQKGGRFLQLGPLGERTWSITRKRLRGGKKTWPAKAGLKSCLAVQRPRIMSSGLSSFFTKTKAFSWARALETARFPKS